MQVIFIYVRLIGMMQTLSIESYIILLDVISRYLKKKRQPKLANFYSNVIRLFDQIIIIIKKE